MPSIIQYFRWRNVRVYTLDNEAGSTSTPTTLSIVRNGSRNGGGLRGYRQIIANHGNATTDLTADGTELVMENPGKFTLQVKPGVGQRYTERVTGILSAPTSLWSPNGMSYTAVDNRARAKFFSECDKAISEFSGGEFFGEIGETIRMLRRPFSGIRDHLSRYLDHVRQLPKSHKGFRSFRQAEKMRLIGQTWLEYRFGLRPLVKDVNAILEQLGEQVDVERFAPVMAWEVQDDVQSQNVVSRQLINNHTYVLAQDKRIGNIMVRYKGEVRIKPQAPGLKGLIADGANLDFEHFVPTIWELLPSSWLVDYFLNVGDVLRGMFFDTSKVAWHCRTIRRRVIHQTTATPDVQHMKSVLGTSYDGVTGSGSFLCLQTKHVIRDRPGLTWITPELKFPDYPIQFVNMGALFYQSRKISEAIARSGTYTQ